MHIVWVLCASACRATVPKMQIIFNFNEEKMCASPIGDLGNIAWGRGESAENSLFWHLNRINPWIVEESSFRTELFLGMGSIHTKLAYWEFGINIHGFTLWISLQPSEASLIRGIVLQTGWLCLCNGLESSFINPVLELSAALNGPLSHSDFKSLASFVTDLMSWGR